MIELLAAAGGALAVGAYAGASFAGGKQTDCNSHHWELNRRFLDKSDRSGSGRNTSRFDWIKADAFVSSGHNAGVQLYERVEWKCEDCGRTKLGWDKIVHTTIEELKDA